MKIICQQTELAKHLQIAARALASKSTLPILTGILLETKDSTLRCVATDLEVAIEVYVSGIQVLQPGAVVLPGKTFMEIIRHLPPEKVELEYDDNTKMLSIIGEHSSYQLPVLPKEEFPTLPEFRGGEKIIVNGEELKEAIRQTIYATLAEDPRPFLSSVLWEIEAGRLRVVATDVNRLAIRDLAIQGGINANALLPVRSLREIGNVFGGGTDETLEITLSDKLIFIRNEGVLFSSRLVEAQFPRYEQVVPKEFAGTALVNRDQLVEALERTALVSYSVRVHFSEKGMFITAKEPEKGKSYEELNTEFSGKEIEIGFNVRFLLDFLKVSASERVVFKYLQEQKPVLIQGIEAENYVYVVMPLKLQG